MNRNAFAIACCTLLVPLANAEYTNVTLLDLSLEELMNVKVSVASISKTSLNESPASVSVFTKKQIRNMGAGTLEELLHFVPGFNSSRRVELGQGYAISARGRTTAQSSFDILVLMNGQRMNTEWSGGAFFSNRFISLKNVKQVEIIRGPGSAIYGSNAFAGVINIITGTESDQVTLTAGSFSQKGISGHVQGSVGETKWSLYLNSDGDDGDDFLAGPNLSIQTQDPIEKQDAEFKLESGGFNANIYYAKRELEDFYQFGRFVNNDVNAFESKQLLLNTQYQWLHNQDIQHQIRFEYGMSERNGLIEAIPAIGIQNLPPTVVTTGTEAFVGGPMAKEQSLRFSYNLNWKINDKHFLHSGMSFRTVDLEKLRNVSNYDFADFVQTFVLSGPPPTGPLTYLGSITENAPFGEEDTRDITSLFVQDEWRITDNVVATIGVRRDDYSDFGAATTPRIALVYQYNDQHIFKFMYGEAFRAPSRREQTTRANPVVRGNTNIDPEEVSTSEIAWAYTSQQFNSSVTLFHSRFQQLIQQIPIGGTDPRNTWVNEGELDTSGIETEFKWELMDSFHIDGYLSYLFETEETPQKFPRFTAGLIANYQFNKFNINLNGTYVGSAESLVQEIGEPLKIAKHDGYFHLNSNLIYQFNQHWQAHLAIKNLLNDDYHTPTNTSALVNGVPNRGRSWLASISYHF